MFSIGLGGESSEGEPFWMMPGVMVDQPAFVGPVGQDRLEDLQLWQFLWTLGSAGRSLHPLTVEVGEDPPDRWLRHKARRWGLELTELTVADVKPALSRLRVVGRDLTKLLNTDPATYIHLRGKLVALFANSTDVTLKEAAIVIPEVAGILREDRGFVGEGVDFSLGLPEHIGSRGFYGQLGPFIVTVQSGVGGEEILATVTTQARVDRKDALESLARRILAKDKPGNHVLLITCGIPDKQGYMSPIDQGIFDLIDQAHAQGINLLPPGVSNVTGVAIHQWGTERMVLIGEGCPWE